MAWMRLMGADSVAYHKDTVLSRSDDHPGQALAYYASRGETPLAWGGSGAGRLGLAGAVTEAQYEALYGPGGACDPTTGARLARTTRPGMELVVSAHKSVAELGVLGRAEHMHAILDAERDATLSTWTRVTRTMGGRRGRERAVAPPRASSMPTPATPPPEPAIPVPMSTCCWPTWWRWEMPPAAGRRRTWLCGGTTSTPPPWWAGWPRPGWR